MPSLPAVRAFNAAFSPSYLPVAVFVGGTSGIGQAMAEAFARYTKGNAQIILIGRNRPGAESIIASFPKPASMKSGWRHDFVACDVSLMKNIQMVTSDLLRRLPKINFLVISSGYVSFLGRNETEEGIDQQLALRYYGRWKLISDLLPALREANRLGEASKVMSVLDPLSGAPVDSNDFGLKQKYSGLTAIKASLTYMDLGLEARA
jgi:NAD(P)-dependent dehydrogenase (short-subunit alcohol dehydrogenase family)